MISGESFQHGRAYDREDLKGWFLTEKLDGCRGGWDGKVMRSRSGRVFPIPKPWAEALPKMKLDGEVWAGRGGFDYAKDAVVHNKWASHVVYMVFDAPDIPGRWSERLAAAAAVLQCTFSATVPWCIAESTAHASELFRRIRLQGGEGLIAVDPTAERYVVGRSGRVLKIKKCPITGELAWRERRRFWRRQAA